MDSFKVQAYVREFPHIPKHIFEFADVVKIRKIDVNVLTNTIFDVAPRDHLWNGAAGDSYKEQTRFAVIRNAAKDIKFHPCEYSPIETLYCHSKDEGSLIAVVDIIEEGGYDVAENKNEFNYGTCTTVIIYKFSKSISALILIEEAIQKAKLEVKREADF